MCGARRFVAVFVCVGLARMSPSPSGFCTFAHGSCTGPCTFARRLLHICPAASAHLPVGLAHLPAGFCTGFCTFAHGSCTEPCTFARRPLHFCPLASAPYLARGNPPALVLYIENA